MTAVLTQVRWNLSGSALDFFTDNYFIIYLVASHTSYKNSLFRLSAHWLIIFILLISWTFCVLHSGYFAPVYLRHTISISFLSLFGITWSQRTNGQSLPIPWHFIEQQIKNIFFHFLEPISSLVAALCTSSNSLWCDGSCNFLPYNLCLRSLLAIDEPMVRILIIS